MRRRLAEEMELVNKEVQIVRHERLKKYYDTCYEECVAIKLSCYRALALTVSIHRWDQELRARGLAIVRERD